MTMHGGGGIAVAVSKRNGTSGQPFSSQVIEVAVL
jgi:hypothetical protein